MGEIRYSEDGRTLMQCPTDYEGPLEIPHTVRKISKDAFSGCTGLTSVIVPDSVKEIGRNAFADCTSLVSVVIPDGVKKIGEDAFRGCTSLSEEDGLRYAGIYLIEAVDRSLDSYDIRENTKFIGNEAFFWCSNLRSIVIPDSVKVVGERAFEGCESLTDVEIADSVTEIGSRAFWGCIDLKSIVIPDSVTRIDESAFCGCGLQDLHMCHQDPEQIDVHICAFDDCIVYVPIGMESAYRQHPYFGQFRTIYEE